MSDLVTSSTAVGVLSAKQIDLVRRTVAKDTTAAEFDVFMHTARHLRLDPLRRQIYVFVFGKADDDRRKMAIVTGIDGYRTIAARTGAYRPDNRAPRFTIDEALVNDQTNPHGILKAEVSAFKFSHGEWHEVVGEAYWDEYAPIIQKGEGGEEWQDTGKVYPSGHKKAGKPVYKKVAIGDAVFMLDPQKPNWRKMGRIMIAKCAEAQAIRRGWPDDVGGAVTHEEIDREHTLDLTATEIADAAATDAKLALVGGKDAVTIRWDADSPLERVPLGRIADAVIAWSSKPGRTADEMKAWWAYNLPARMEYKAKRGSEYLDFQKAFEGRRDALWKAS